MTQPAARAHDRHICPTHISGEQLPRDRQVNVNGVPLVAAGCRCGCAGASDFILTGSGTVRLAFQPVARIGSLALHHGGIILGSSNVNVGGPSAGGILGNPGFASKHCQGLDKGRVPGGWPNQQSHGDDCGVESVRLLINTKTGSTMTENQLLDYAVGQGLATHKVGEFKITHDENGKVRLHADHFAHSGGTGPESRSTLLTTFGVPNEQVEQTPENIAQGVAEGRGVITAHYADMLWDNQVKINKAGVREKHAINVTGIEYDGDGRIVRYITADTGLGQCERFVDAAQFERSLREDRKAVVTKTPVWES